MTVNVRGAHYRSAMERFTPLLLERVRKVVSERGKLTPVDIGRMAIALDLPIKTTFDFLGYAGVIPTGTWERKRYTAKMIKGKIRQEDINEPRTERLSSYLSPLGESGESANAVLSGGQAGQNGEYQ